MVEQRTNKIAYRVEGRFDRVTEAGVDGFVVLSRVDDFWRVDWDGSGGRELGSCGAVCGILGVGGAQCAAVARHPAEDLVPFLVTPAQRGDIGRAGAAS